MLHWAEGSKKRNGVALTNSDPEMLRLSSASYAVPAVCSDERIGLAVNCHLNNGLSLAEIERGGWPTLGLPRRACVAPP